MILARSHGALRLITTLVAALIIGTAAGGAGASGTGAAPAPGASPSITRERVQVPGAPEPHTPPPYNQAVAFRYFVDGAPAPEVVLVLIPGLNSGPNTLDILARGLLAGGTGLEVWVVDPRPTLLQDRRGVAAALSYGNPDFALGYYYGSLSIDGATYHPVSPDAVPYAAYWGLDVHLRDIHAIVREVRRRDPDARVVLGGHSLGGILAAFYAGYDFGRPAGPAPVPLVRGVPAPSPAAGARDLSGLVLLDGMPLRLLPHLTPRQYLHGFHIPFVARFPGVLALTSRKQEPFADTSVLARPKDSILFDVIATYAYLRPRDQSRLPFYPRDGLAITNEALLGSVLSDRMQPDPFVRASVGSPLGSFKRTPDPANINRDGLLDLASGRPAPGETLIRWIPYDRSTPPGRVDLRALEAAILRPGGDFTQWYVPWRLVLDLGLAAALDTSDAFDREYVSLTQVRYTTLPILIIGAGRGLVRSAKETRYYLSHIATPAADVRVEILQGFTHLDIEDAVDNPAVPGILDWLRAMVH